MSQTSFPAAGVPRASESMNVRLTEIHTIIQIASVVARRPLFRREVDPQSGGGGCTHDRA